MLSVIVPSRCDEFLQKTIDDVIEKADGAVEVIIVLDGYWPQTQIKENKQVKIIHHGTIHDSFGMRETINKGIRIAQGEYIMKTDEHCMFNQGYDKRIIAEMEDNWVVVPRRYRLDPYKWEMVKDGRPPIDYMFLTYPFVNRFDWRKGLYGQEWKERYWHNKKIPIDDTMSCQGSCYIMSRKHWDNIGEMDSRGYGQFNNEAQEIGNKTWLSGGRLVVNKNTWYAHFHKGKTGKKYGFSNEQYKSFMWWKEKGRQYCIDYWMNNKWKERKHDFKWLIEKFWPVPTWPEDWETRWKEDQKYDFANSKEDKKYTYKGEPKTFNLK